MEAWITSIIVLLILALGVVFVLFSKKPKKESSGKVPEGTYIGTGMALGAGIGVALGSIPIGVGIGFVLGFGMEQRAKQEGKLRPLTDVEKKRQKYAVLVGLSVLALLVFIFFMTL